MQGVARDLLSSRIVVIDAALPIARADALLLSHQADELFVTDSDGRLLGVVPDYALLRWRLLPDGAQRVAEIMSAGVPTVAPDTPLIDIAVRLRMHVHARIPVAEQGRLLGVVTRRSLLQRLASDQSNTLSGPIAASGGVSPAGRLAAPNFLKSVRTAVVPTVPDRL